MKRLLIVFIAIGFSSCSKKSIDFKGFEGFDIGYDFNSMPQSKLFRMTMTDEYNAGKFILSNQIGSVSNLNVTTQKGKICEVKFHSNQGTTISELKKLYGNLVKVKVNNQLKLIDTDIEFYTTPNKKIVLFVSEDKSESLKSGKPIYDYDYVDSNYAEKKSQELDKRISNN